VNIALDVSPKQTTFSNIYEYTQVRNLFSASIVTSVLPGRETFNNITEYIRERNLSCAHSVAGVSVMKNLFKFI